MSTVIGIRALARRIFPRQADQSGPATAPWQRNKQSCVVPILLCLLAAIPSFGQELTARFYAQKPAYALRAPLWFVFEVTNKGRAPLYIENANPYGVCAFMGGYSFQVPGARAGRWRCGYIASCSGGGPPIRLAPGTAYSQRLLLNQWFAINHAGRYRVEARRNLRFSQREDSSHMLVAPKSRALKSEFYLNIVPGNAAQVEKALAPFIKRLNAPNFQLRTEAIETITAVAPPFLEKKIIALATGDDSYAQSRAIPALGRLNTPAPRRVLAKLVEDRQPYYSWMAIDALAETHDLTYLPLLERLAKEPTWQNLAIPAAGLLGGPEAIPFLRPFVDAPLGPPSAPPVQQLAMRGLANTGSRRAIPYLIEGLHRSLVQRDAVNGLEQLTHLVIFAKDGKHWLYPDDDKTADRIAERWQQWWKTKGRNARLFGPDDCTGAPEALPSP